MHERLAQTIRARHWRLRHLHEEAKAERKQAEEHIMDDDSQKSKKHLAAALELEERYKIQNGQYQNLVRLRNTLDDAGMNRTSVQLLAESIDALEITLADMPEVAAILEDLQERTDRVSADTDDLSRPLRDDDFELPDVPERSLVKEEQENKSSTSMLLPRVPILHTN